MTRLVVVEARRLLPIFVLLALLVAVSIYDGVSAPAAPATAEPNAVPYRLLTEGASGSGMSMQVVSDLDMWVAMHKVLGKELTDYDFQPESEVAVFLLNCQLQSTVINQGTVELAVVARNDAFQLVLFDKEHFAGEDYSFKLIDAN